MMGETGEVRGGYMVVYTDHGPGGICGQSMSITCPHAYVSIFDTYEEAKTAIEAAGEKIGRGGLRRNVVQGDINGGPIRLHDHRAGAAELARVTAERDEARALLTRCWDAAGLLGDNMTGKPDQAWEEGEDLVQQIEDLAGRAGDEDERDHLADENERLEAELAEARAEAARLREALERIAEHTDPDSPEENYRADDSEGCLDTVFALARAALQQEPPHAR